MGRTTPRPFFHNSITPDHLIAPFQDNRPDAEWIAGIDPGWTSPCALIIGKCDGDGRIHISYAAVHVHNQFAKIRDEIDLHTRAECQWLGVDPAMREHNQQTGLSGLDWWREHDFLPAVYPTAVRERLRLVRCWLAQNALQGGLTICHEAAILHDALTSYAVAFPKDAPAQCLTPSKSHLVDALSYMLLRYADLLASKAFNERGLPFGHAAA